MTDKAHLEESLSKNNVSDTDRAKEFDAQGRLDDADAFEETADAALQSKLDELRALATWRPANALKKLQQQVNAAFPNRKKSHDGMIGDTAHCPGSSDHCPNINDNGVGVVTAFDITHDPANGCDMKKVTAAVIESRDTRIKYIIYNSRICSSYPHGGVAAWTWRNYSGSNPHDKHAHFSVVSAKPKYDDMSDWTIA